jgi:hypothetical protein
MIINTILALTVQATMPYSFKDKGKTHNALSVKDKGQTHIGWDERGGGEWLLACLRI